MTSVMWLAENMGHREGESLSAPGREAAIKELTRGRESVAKLASLLQVGSSGNCRPESARTGILVEEIMGTINRAIAALESWKTTEAEANQVESPSSCVTSSKQSSGGKRKMQGRARKDGYRKRGRNSYSWTKVTTTTINDAYAWRKYGQKDIFSAKYPRSYFRCTHKFDQGCMALRQVQKSEEDPSLFVITYFGEHTCCATAKALPPCGDPCIISFESNTEGGNVKQVTPSSLPSLKQESEEDVLSNLTSADSPADCFVSPEVEVKESEAGLSRDQNDSSSGLHSFLIGYGMEFMDLEDLFTFDNTEFFQD